MADFANRRADPGHAVPALPVAGYPISEDAVSHWCAQPYGRAPIEQERGSVIDAMARRAVSEPSVGSDAKPQCWAVGPSPSLRSGG